MATNPSEIHLSEEQKRRIAKRADQNGQSWQDVLQEVLGPENTEFDEDTECLAHCAQELQEIEAELGLEVLTIENARRILARDPRPMSQDIIEDRGDR